jgi:hypothetical protein
MRLGSSSRTEPSDNRVQRDGNVTQQDIEDNKLLGHVLEKIRQQQLVHSQQQLTFRNYSLREKRRIRELILQRK